MESELKYMWPMSDADAQSVYLSTEWGEMDDFGYPRVHPCEKWWSESERVPPYIHPSMKVQLGDLLGNSGYSLVYSVPGTSWAIKYHAYRPDALDPHESTLVEGYFLKLLSQWLPEVSHRLIYFSKGFSPWTRSDLKSPEFGTRCPGQRSRVPVVRYIITERVGRSISQILRSPVLFSFEDAISCGIRIFQLLEKIHERRVVHGDIHPGNIAFRSDAETQHELILIDFGRARVVDVGEAIGTVKSVPYCHPHVSPWEALYSGPPTYRDDAFRAVLVMASMMFGHDYLVDTFMVCFDLDGKKFSDGAKTFARTRLRENLFDIPPVVTRVHYPLTRVLLPRFWRAPAFGTIMNSLIKVQELIRKTAHSEVPDYPAIIGWLEHILFVMG